MVAAAAEDAARPWSRAMVVGSTAWMLDPTWAAVDAASGGLSQPGDIELFEAGVAWLAGQDGLIGASVTARPMPLIRPMDPGLVSGLRWGLIAGLPLGVLVIGGVCRKLGV
jgi:hypothetical protein